MKLNRLSDRLYDRLGWPLGWFGVALAVTGFVSALIALKVKITVQSAHQ